MKDYNSLEKTNLEKERKRLKSYLVVLLLVFFSKIAIIYYIEKSFGTYAAIVGIVIILSLIWIVFLLLDKRIKTVEKLLAQKKLKKAK